MTTAIEYALMAGASYISNRDPLNQFPIPQGWQAIRHDNPPDGSGFEAISFIDGATLATSTNIVISFAGTYPKNPDGSALPIPIDLQADIDLAAGASIGSRGYAQLLQAAEYYLDVKRQNPGATITLTGHSLGGGLAALVGVFFHVPATTFDQAPFANSAQSNSLLSNPLNIFTPDVAANLKTSLLAAGYTDGELAFLSGYLLIRPTDGSIPNSNLINTIRVDGEFTSALGVGVFDPIGNPADILKHGPYSSPSIDLHDQTLLTAFLQSGDTATSTASNHTLGQATIKLTDLLGMIFNPNLYAFDTDKAKVNFLEHLVRHQTGGVDGVQPGGDAMVTRFTADLWKLAQDGGITISENLSYSNWNNVSKALIAFAMQKYYEENNPNVSYGTELFTDLSAAGLGSNGITFDIANVSQALDTKIQTGNVKYEDLVSDIKGFGQYFQTYLDTTGLLSSEERTLIKTMLPVLRDWYVQAGANGMVADASTGSAQANRGAFITKNNERSDYDFLEKTLAVLRGGNDWMRWRSCTVNDSAWRAAA